MMSLEHLATVKIAVQICCNYEMKRTILFTYVDRNFRKIDHKKEWNDVIERKAADLLIRTGLPPQLQLKVLNFVPAIAIRILAFSKYHIGTLNLHHRHTIEFLNCSYFTQRGILDDKKAAEGLINDNNLTIEQKYKLSCLYCLVNHIRPLYNEMTKESKAKFRSTTPQRELVTFWSLYLNREARKLSGDKPIPLCRLEIAVNSGHKEAVTFCLEKASTSGTDETIIVEAAMKAVRKMIIQEDEDEWAVFRNRKVKKNDREIWTPAYLYDDLLFYLLSKMTREQKSESLKNTMPLFQEHRTGVLQIFLDWPYQHYFMETVGLMWEFLPERTYAALFLEISHKITPGLLSFIKLGEEKTYDYTRLLREFWAASPERYKIYVLSNQLFSNIAARFQLDQV